MITTPLYIITQTQEQANAIEQDINNISILNNGMQVLENQFTELDTAILDTNINIQKMKPFNLAPNIATLGTPIGAGHLKRYPIVFNNFPFFDNTQGTKYSYRMLWTTQSVDNTAHVTYNFAIVDCTFTDTALDPNVGSCLGLVFPLSNATATNGDFIATGLGFMEPIPLVDYNAKTVTFYVYSSVATIPAFGSQVATVWPYGDNSGQ